MEAAGGKQSLREQIRGVEGGVLPDLELSPVENTFLLLCDSQFVVSIATARGSQHTIHWFVPFHSG